MSHPVSVRNPTFSPYAVDDPPELPEPYRKGIENPAYENYQADTNNASLRHYEDPSDLTNGVGRRQKASPIYESTERFAKDANEEVQPYKESKLGFVLLFIILLISLVALVLVILIILGKLGPACSCNNQANPSNPQKFQSGGSIASLTPLYDEMAALKRNLSIVTDQLNTQNDKISALQNELNTAKSKIQQLESCCQNQDITAIWRQANSTKDRVTNIEISYTAVHQQLQKAINESKTTSKSDDKILEDKLQKNITDTLAICKADNAALESRLQKNINDTVDFSRNQDAALEAKLQKNINDGIDKCMEVNSTLTSKIDAVSKMEGPKGPRGFNGSQGSEGPRGFNGSKGEQGDTGMKGDKGDQGRPGAGNLTQCVVKTDGSTPSQITDGSASSITITEETGEKIIHFSCSSNIADTVQQSQVVVDGKNRFTCNCKGKSSYGTLPTHYICYITYTKCPLIS